MARKRMIDPSIWADEGMAALSPRQQVLYIGLFSNADDEGRLKGSAAAIRLLLPAVYVDATVDEVGVDLGAVLHQMRQLVAYGHEGRAYLAFRNYAAWQKIAHPSPSVLPAPPEDTAPYPPEPNGHRALAEDSANAHEPSRNAHEPSRRARASRARAEIKLVEEKLVEEKIRGGGVRGGDASQAAAAAAPPVPRLLKHHAPDVGPLVDAFAAVGLSPPKMLGGEGPAAQHLLGAGYSPEQLAACWQDIASGDYGDAYMQRKLSFGLLSRDNCVGNWQRWKAQPSRAPSSGRGKAAPRQADSDFSPEANAAAKAAMPWLRSPSERLAEAR